MREQPPEPQGKSTYGANATCYAHPADISCRTDDTADGSASTDAEIEDAGIDARYHSCAVGWRHGDKLTLGSDIAASVADTPKEADAHDGSRSATSGVQHEEAYGHADGHGANESEGPRP